MGERGFQLHIILKESEHGTTCAKHEHAMNKIGASYA